MKKKQIPLIAPAEKHVYEGFFGIIVVLFILCTFYTEFNPVELFRKSENFWLFLSEDFFPPALPKAEKILNILESVFVTVAMAISATTAAADRKSVV